MYDEDSRLLLELQYRSIEELLIKLGRYPTREEVIEAVVLAFDNHMAPNVIMLN